MTAGIAVSKSDADSQAASLAIALRSVLSDVSRLAEWFAARSGDDLIAMGWTGTEANVIKSAYNDLGRLAAIFAGQDVQAVQYDFLTFARQLTGFS